MPSPAPSSDVNKPGSQDEDEDDGISPLLSRAPPLVLPPSSAAQQQQPPRLQIPTDADNNNAAATPNSASDDVIPDEHKRIPGLIPRSPLSPIRALGLGVGLGLSGFMSRRGTTRTTTTREGDVGEDDLDTGATAGGRWGRMRKGRRKPAPPPIVVVHPPPRGACACGRAIQASEEEGEGKCDGAVVVAASVRGSIVDGLSPGLESALEKGETGSGSGSGEKKKRRTVWGMIDGWWDLGLLERMGTVRRKR